MTDSGVNPDECVETTSSLLQRAVSREQGAWERMVALYGPLVYHWCRRWGLQPSDAENVGQEVFAHVLKGLPSFRSRPDSGSFRGWLYRISRNCFVDHLRRLPPEVIGLAGGEEQSAVARLPAEQFEEQRAAELEQDDSLLCRRAIEMIRAEISPRDWQAFYALVVEQRSAAEIAAELGVSANVVYLAKSRLLKRLRREFEELMDSGQSSD